MRTYKEIVERIAEIGSIDSFGFEHNDLLAYLNFENASSFLKAGVGEDEWNRVRPDYTRGNLEDKIIDYLPFAWDKANGCRSISSQRSLHHFRAWLWLLGDEEKGDLEHLLSYKWYGKKHLVVISRRFGFDWEAHDDGEWRDSERGSCLTAEEALKIGR